MNIDVSRINKDQEALVVMQKYYTDLKDKADSEYEDASHNDDIDEDSLSELEMLTATLDGFTSALENALAELASL